MQQFQIWWQVFKPFDDIPGTPGHAALTVATLNEVIVSSSEQQPFSTHMASNGSIVANGFCLAHELDHCLTFNSAMFCRTVVREWDFSTKFCSLSLCANRIEMKAENDGKSVLWYSHIWTRRSIALQIVSFPWKSKVAVQQPLLAEFWSLLPTRIQIASVLLVVEALKEAY